MRDVRTVVKAIFLYSPFRYGIVAFIRIFGYAGLGALCGLLIKRFFDLASASSLTVGAVYEIAALLVAVPIVQAITYSIDLALSYGLTEIVRATFRRNLFRFVLERPGAAPLPIAEGKLSNLLRTDVAAPESLMWDLSYLSAYFLFSAGGLAMLAAVDWQAAVVLFVPLPAALGAGRLLKRRIGRHIERQQQSSDRFLGLLSDMLRHREAIRVNNAAGAFLKRLRGLGDERADAGRRGAVCSAALASVNEYIVAGGTALLLLALGGKLRSGEVTVGGFALFVFFLGYMSGTVRLMSAAAAGVRKTEAALSRIGELLGTDPIRKLTASDSLYLNGGPPPLPASANPEARPPIRIEVRRLSCAYPGTDKGVRDISFVLPPSSFTVITGPVGSGKTTLLRALLGLLPDVAGDIVWRGERDRIGDGPLAPPLAAYVPQVPFLFGGTIRDNILLGHADDSFLREALHIAVLEQDLARFPDGLDTRIGPGGATLSGGQRQRVAVARMAVRRAPLWVLDDISSALDAETEIEMWRRIDALRRRDGMTCLVVSNKPYALRCADQIIALRDGRMEAPPTG
ncbi:ABC transporter ATP-binding protein [Paenibacillus sp. GYB003]|uniref:ABC transporter ATP-binding protein n=1 Tax=Paenibacillus sp. GYB003 TaxID=2994392 RepID=UPI002F96508C